MPDPGYPRGREAPERLEVVRRFVNTANLESGAELLHSPQALAAWLSAHGLKTTPSPTTAQLQLAVQLRETLRRLLVANHDGTTDAEASAELTRLAHRLGLQLIFTSTGPVVAAAGEGVEGGLGELVAVTAHAMLDGSWRRLKACASSSCRWAFYDRSRGGTGQWCSMGVCGSRAKSRAYRRRQRNPLT
jgi:predicted RNA-binding Zn ribbon-like protein